MCDFLIQVRRPHLPNPLKRETISDRLSWNLCLWWAFTVDWSPILSPENRIFRAVPIPCALKHMRILFQYTVQLLIILAIDFSNPFFSVSFLNWTTNNSKCWSNSSIKEQLCYIICSWVLVNYNTGIRKKVPVTFPIICICHNPHSPWF